jgi:putative transposase
MQPNTTYRKDPCLKRYNIPGHAHGLTFSCVQRKTFLNSKYVKHFLAESINMSREKYNFEVRAYVFMPEHVHILLFPTDDIYSVSNILKSIKTSSSRKLINFLELRNPKALKYLETGLPWVKYRLWKHGGGYDRNFWSKDELIKQIEYIHNNPIRRELVENPEDWFWSSARFWKTGEKGPVVVETDNFPVG